MTPDEYWYQDTYSVGLQQKSVVRDTEDFLNCPLFMHHYHNDRRIGTIYKNPYNSDFLIGGVSLPFDVQDSWYFRNRAIVSLDSFRPDARRGPETMRVSHLKTVFGRTKYLVGDHKDAATAGRVNPARMYHMDTWYIKCSSQSLKGQVTQGELR